MHFSDHLPSNFSVASFITKKILNKQWRELLLSNNSWWIAKKHIWLDQWNKIMIVENVSSCQTSVFLSTLMSIAKWSSLCSLPTYIIEILKVDTPSMIYSWMENTIQSKIQYNQCHFTLIFKLIYINLFTWLSWTLILSVVNTKNMYTQISHRAKREWINYVCSTARSHMSRGCHEELT